jgi:hypothetical protein
MKKTILFLEKPAAGKERRGAFFPGCFSRQKQ